VNTIDTGYGIWSPIVWTLLFLGILGIGFWIRSLGRKDYKAGTGQTKVFLAGNEEPDPEGLHVRGDHLYWGMIAGFSGYYERIRRWHTGVLSDYAAWFIGVLSIVFVILGLIR